VTAGAGGGGGYLHHALFYDSPQALVGAAGPFLRAGLAAGDLPVLVCSDRNNALLTEALRGEAEVVVLEPASIYTGWWTRSTATNDWCGRSGAAARTGCG
jgi:hypothetical protein